jgi:hypothetical protein
VPCSAALLVVGLRHLIKKKPYLPSKEATLASNAYKNRKEKDTLNTMPVFPDVTTEIRKPMGSIAAGIFQSTPSVEYEISQLNEYKLIKIHKNP